MTRADTKPTDEILEQLKELLTTLEPDARGEARLPAERQLAERLGVQRATVRERLAVLETLGLIRRTQGSGTFLSVPKAVFLQFYFDAALRVGYFTQDEVQQAREVLEREIVRLAALNATQEDLERLDSALQRLREAGDPEERIAADFGFHLALARSAHNAVIVLIVEGLAQVLRQALRQRVSMMYAVPGATARVERAHEAIVEAIRDRDPDQAADAMDEHFWVWKRESGKVSTLFVGDTPE